MRGKKVSTGHERAKGRGGGRAGGRRKKGEGEGERHLPRSVRVPFSFLVYVSTSSVGLIYSAPCWGCACVRTNSSPATTAPLSYSESSARPALTSPARTQPRPCTFLPLSPTRKRKNRPYAKRTCNENGKKKGAHRCPFRSAARLVPRLSSPPARVHLPVFLPFADREGKSDARAALAQANRTSAQKVLPTPRYSALAPSFFFRLLLSSPPPFALPSHFDACPRICRSNPPAPE